MQLLMCIYLNNSYRNPFKYTTSGIFRLSIRYVYFPILLSLLGGCSAVTQLGELPKNESEYHLSKAALVNKYPEIGKYEPKTKEVMRYDCEGPWCFMEPIFQKKKAGLIYHLPDQSQLPKKNEILEALGQPQHVKGSYALHIIGGGVLLASGAGPALSIAIPFIFKMEPDQDYYFIRGNYCIIAYFRRDPSTRYRNLLTSWWWFDDIKKCEQW